jgi:threonine/homoserine/homoserine lactone efflux protein
MEPLLTFIPVAAALTLTPGAATALVIRSAVRGGRREALVTSAGNSLGVLAWAIAAALGVAAVVAASAEAFMVVKIVGAIVLVLLGVQALLGRGRHDSAADPAVPTRPRSALRDGLVTSVANPKLAVFFVGLFPQFVPSGAPVLPVAVAMALIIVALDLVWYSTLAWLVTRAKRAFVEGPWMRRTERLTGSVLVALGARLALERR